ncbi:MAG: Asp-tRNA(Asn)/Glu-tRNA(Gln) amidotransferase subunit GatC [Gemmatimonadota bacterium]
MSITKKKVEQIAALARLELTPEEIEAMARDLASILDHTRELESLDLAGIEPMGGVSDHPAPMRDDVPGADPLQRPLQEIAPDWQESFFIVPRLAAMDGGESVEGEESP